MQARDRVWLFDLDNTLHNATPQIFPQINRSMTEYIERHLSLDHQSANALRQTYWHQYGATLLGLIRHHQIDPIHFLWETHQFPQLASMLDFFIPIRGMLKKLPGKKILFSNAPRHYTEAILQLTRLQFCFSKVYTVESVKFQPKPMRAGFQYLLRKEKLSPKQCIMVEDSLENLKRAKKLGMKTVWLTKSRRQSPWVDIQLGNLLELPSRYGQRK